jgi:hypothetical protein
MEPLLVFLRVQGGALLGLALGLFVAHLARRKKWGAKPRRWAGLALVLALAGSHLALHGWPASPLGEDRLQSHERLFWMLAPAGLACLSSWRHALLPVALVLPLVAMNTLAGWSLDVETWTPRLLLPLALVLLTASGEACFRRRPGFEASLALGLVTAAAAAAIGATGASALAMWAGGRGLAWGLAVLVAWRRWDANLLDGGTLMTWTGGLLLLAARYSELAPLDAGLLAGALPLSLFAEGLAEGPRAKRLMAWGTLLGVLILVAARIGLAIEPDPYAAY